MTITITFASGVAHIVYRIGERIEKQLTLTTPKTVMSALVKMVMDAWQIMDRG